MFTANVSSNTINRTRVNRSRECCRNLAGRGGEAVGLRREHLIQEVLSVEPIPLGRAEGGVAINSDRPSVRPNSCPSRFAKNQQQSQRQRTGVSAPHERRRFAPRTAEDGGPHLSRAPKNFNSGSTGDTAYLAARGESRRRG